MYLQDQLGTDALLFRLMEPQLVDCETVPCSIVFLLHYLVVPERLGPLRLVIVYLTAYFMRYLIDIINS